MSNLIHWSEPTELRRIRIGGNSHTQCLCSNGSYHAQRTSKFSKVTCPKCIELFNKHYIENIHSSN